MSGITCKPCEGSGATQDGERRVCERCNGVGAVPPAKGMTVGDLRAALAGVPDDMEVTIRGDDEFDDPVFCGGILQAHVTVACGDGPPFFAIEASENADLLDAVREDVAEVT